MQGWLQAIEEEYAIEILFACEAGSRAGGYASATSDFDIRFIFKHRDIRKYISLDQPLEVINYDHPFDAQGWDINKAFRLLRKSNPSLFEWSFSPIIYQDLHGFGKKMQGLIGEGYSAYSLAMHYLSLAKRNLKEIEKKELNKQRQKQLLYTLRSLLIVKSLTNGNRVSGNVIPPKLSDVNRPLEPGLKMFLRLMEAKQNEDLITEVEWERVQEELTPLINTLSVQATELEKGENLTVPLNEWLWDLLKE
jgi:uncharacterized protein